MKINFRILAADPILYLVFGLFLVFTLPTIASVPHRDGNINFVQSYEMFRGGFPLLLKNWSTIHPPFLVLAAAGVFKLIGLSAFSFNLLARIIGLAGIWFIYQLSSALIGKAAARRSAVLLAFYPLYLANSLFPVTDGLLAVCISASVLAYVRKKLIWMAFFLTMGILIKETGVILPVVILMVESISLLTKIALRQKHSGFRQIFICVGIPLFIFLLWVEFLSLKGITPWSAHILATTANYGSFYTVVYNLITLSFINPYAIQNWLHLFVLNFAWVYWGVFLTGICIYWVKRGRRILTEIISNKTILIIISFCLSYVATVLSFQTYTIPRYVLPVVPFLVLGCSWAIGILVKKKRYLEILSIVFAGCLMVVSLFYSVDPLSRWTWGTTSEDGVLLYDLRGHTSGNDGVTYNLQYEMIVARRMAFIKSIENGNTTLLNEGECKKVFPDPSNDKITLQTLGFNKTMQEGQAHCMFNW